jgi:glutamate/tyrosine decarboxylase-like PLP-dependent enzyme
MSGTVEAPRLEPQPTSAPWSDSDLASSRESMTLFPPRDDQRRWNDFLSRRLAQADARVAAGAVTPTIDLALFKRDLAAFDFEKPRALDAVLEWTIAQLEHGLVHVTHPRYFGLFNPAPSFPAQCADRVAAAFNPQLATSATSPVAVEIEAHVVRSIARRAGLPAAAGHFTTGGSEANYTGLICALTRADSGFASEGARAFAGPPVFYTSRESHLAWLKIAHQAGIGRAAARFVATDGCGRMDANALADALRQDRARGCVPIMVVGTAGTTNAGMIDPLTDCAGVARRAGAWYHVDAAWGGAVVASDRLRKLLAGIELADSVTIDAHKWLAATMGCGMFITTHPPLLSQAFQVFTSYMPSHIAHLDPYVTSIQWSRRFLGLRLFLSFAAAGWSGCGAHVERSVALAQLLREQLAAHGWTTVNDPSLAVLCIEPPPDCVSVPEIVARVIASGRAWVSTAMFEGRRIIRACVTHGETTPDDVSALVDALRAAGQA